jgi:hypothetical protein
LWLWLDVEFAAVGCVLWLAVHYLAVCMLWTVREDWLEPTESEGGSTVGRAWAVTMELVELCGDRGVSRGCLLVRGVVSPSRGLSEARGS